MLGWGCRAALDALAETGTDITRFHAGGNLGRVHPAGQPVRQAQRTFEVQELQRYLGLRSAGSDWFRDTVGAEPAGQGSGDW